MRDIRVVLHNIRSSHNVGSIFRTSDAVGVRTIYLSGYTPRPIDRFGRKEKNIAKTALGAEHTILWHDTPNLSKLITQLKKDGFQIIAIEQDKYAIDYKKIKLTNRVVFILGNEVRGLSKSILKHCDAIAEIPMLGMKESLNVTVAFGIAVFRMLNI